jgi:hypothetical protein
MEAAGKHIRDDSEETRREAAAAMGRARTPAKIRAARETAAARRGVPLSEEHREKIRVAQEARWEKYRAEKAAAAAANPVPPKEPKRIGRPPKPVDPDAVKRSRGRPKATQSSASPVQD